MNLEMKNDPRNSPRVNLPLAERHRCSAAEQQSPFASFMRLFLKIDFEPVDDVEISPPLTVRGGLPESVRDSQSLRVDAFVTMTLVLTMCKWNDSNSHRTIQKCTTTSNWTLG